MTRQERAVLDALRDCPKNVLETLAHPDSVLGKWTAPFARAALALRKAEKSCPDG